MSENKNIVSTYNVTQKKTENLCLIDPMMILIIVLIIGVLFYFIEYRPNN
jgi:hypothetical protein